MSALNDISVDLYPDSNINTVVAVYMTCSVAGLLIAMSYHWQLNANVFLIATGILGCAHLMLASIAQWYPNWNPLLIVVISIAGLSSSISQACAYGLAASTPEIHTGWVSLGNGFAGLLTFSLWLCLSQRLFVDQTSRSLWVMCALGSCFSFGSCLAYAKLRNERRMKKRLAERIVLARELSRHPDHPTTYQLIAKSWESCVCVFIVLYLSLLIYPNSAPLSWIHEGRYRINVLLGLFQLGDFAGRYIPLVSTKTTLPSPRHLLKLGLSRIVFVIPLLFGTQSWIDASYWLHCTYILLLSLTNGWFTTAAMIKGVQKFRSFRFQPYRDRYSSLLVLFLVLGICSGLWTADLLAYNVKT